MTQRDYWSIAGIIFLAWLWVAPLSQPFPPVTQSVQDDGSIVLDFPYNHSLFPGERWVIEVN